LHEIIRGYDSFLKEKQMPIVNGRQGVLRTDKSGLVLHIQKYQQTK